MTSLYFHIALILLILVEITFQSKIFNHSLIIISTYVLKFHICIQKQGEYLVSQEFTTKTFSDSSSWTYNRVTLCSSTDYVDFSDSNIMGILVNNEYQKKIFSNLPPHWSASVRFDLLLMGFLEKTNNDRVEIFIENKLYDNYEKENINEGFVFCSPKEIFEDSLILYNKNITHYAETIEIKIHVQTNINDKNKGVGIKNFFLYLDICDPSCLTCNGPSTNNCLTCPPNSNKIGNTCACNSGYNQHTNSCVSSCPTGYVKQQSTNKWVSNNCTDCSSCDTTNNICKSCNSGLYLYKGTCVSSCPYTAPLTLGVCKDYDSIISFFKSNKQDGQYLLNGLTNNFFGESEILGMGFIITGFKGNKQTSSSGAYTTHCGNTQLFGGYYLSGKDSSITRSWTSLPPHWSVKIGFTLWKIDSWDTESVYFKVDGTTVETFTYNDSDGIKNSCGDFMKDHQNVYSKNFTHTSTSLSISFITNFDENPYNESYGLRDFYLLVDFCTPFCVSCNASGCLVCQSNYLMHLKKCVPQCSDGSYSNTSTTCSGCDKSCKSCFGGLSTNCITCFPKMNFYKKTNECLNTCPDGTYRHKIS